MNKTMADNSTRQNSDKKHISAQSSETGRQESIVKALEKLRDLFLNAETELFGYIGGRQWDFQDPNNPSLEEIRALRFLKAANVIDYYDGYKSGDDFPYEPEPKFEADVFPNPEEVRKYIEIGMYNGVRLTKFNLEQFEKLCKAYGLNPYKKEYYAKLSFRSKISIETSYGIYTHSTGKEGLPYSIINFCSKYPDQSIKKSILEKNIPTMKNGKRSLSAIFSDSKTLFDLDSGALAPFMDVEKDKIRLRTQATLNIAEFERIKNQFRQQK